MGSISNHFYPYKKRKERKNVHKNGHVTTETDWSDAATKQEMPRIVGSHQKLDRGKKGFFPRAFRGCIRYNVADT